MKFLQTLSIALTLMPLAASGQLVRLCGDTACRALFFDLDKLWRYNLYEKSRWGAGLVLTTHTPDGWLADRRRHDFYAGYGYATRRWAGGVSSKLHLKGTALSVGLSVRHDLVPAASRQLGEANWTDLSSLSAFLARRMSERTTFGGSLSYDASPLLATLEGTYWLGYRTYDSHGSLLYLHEGDAMPRDDGYALRLTLAATHGTSLQLQVGQVQPCHQTFARLLGQYRLRDTVSWLATSFFTQAGIASAGAPYDFLFNLGGSYDLPLYLPGTLVTTRPDELTADCFALASLRLQPVRPLFSMIDHDIGIGTNPSPFVATTVLWGILRGGNWSSSSGTLVPPDQGLMELTAGIDGLLRWGAVDWGVAATWRQTPQRAPYHHPSWHRNLTLTLTAHLLLPHWENIKRRLDAKNYFATQ